jgi:hypothetical protein
MPRRGGAVLGTGLSGVVHDEVLPCKDPSKTPTGPLVTKVLKPGRKPTEYETVAVFREKLRELDIGIFPESLCEGPSGEFQLYLKYGGLSLADYGFPDAPTIDAGDVKAALDALLTKIRAMNALGVYHNDLSFDNILYSPETKVAYLIDFERATLGPPKLKELTPAQRKQYSPAVLARREIIALHGDDTLALEGMIKELAA